MPLFKKNHNKHENDSGAADNIRDDSTMGPGTNTGIGSTAREEQRYDSSLSGGNTQGSGGYGDPNLTGPNVAGRGAHHDFATSDRHNVVPGQYPAGQQDQYGPGTGTGRTGATDVYGGQLGSGAGTGAGIGGQQQQHRSGGGHLAGKVEHGVGAMVGSKALEARGAEKEHEMNAIKQQSAEISEAERLERQAAELRERAVAHGAHPDNSKLGGGMI